MRPRIVETSDTLYFILVSIKKKVKLKTFVVYEFHGVAVRLVRAMYIIGEATKIPAVTCAHTPKRTRDS
jgi:hypothetical protein